MRLSTRPLLASLGSALVLLSFSTPAFARPLCITDPLTAGHIVLPKPKIKRASNNELIGYYATVASFNPVIGSVIVDTSGTEFGFSLQIGNSALNAGAPSAGNTAARTVSFAMLQLDGVLDIGDSSPGYFNGGLTTFVIEDCAVAPFLP